MDLVPFAPVPQPQSRESGAKLIIGVPDGIRLEIPAGPLLTRAATFWRRPAPVGVVATTGDISLQSYCEGSAVVYAEIIHPGSMVCPVHRIDVEQWLFNEGVDLGVQPFFAHVEGRSEERHTRARIELKLGEAQIKRIKGVMGDALWKSEVMRLVGIPYNQRLRVRFHFRGHGEKSSPMYELKYHNIAVQALGNLERAIEDL